MPMSLEDKKKCSKIYEAYTGYYIAPHRWNEAAADLLSRFVYDVIKCSRGLGAVKAIFPVNPKISWTYLVKATATLLNNEMKLKKGYRNQHCINAKLVGMGNYKTNIESAILLGK